MLSQGTIVRLVDSQRQVTSGYFLIYNILVIARYHEVLRI